MCYEYYRDTYKGELSEYEFNELYKIVYDIFMMFVETKVLYLKIKSDMLDDVEYYRSFCIQIDFIHSLGGLDSVSGNNPLEISSAQTAGFKYQYNKSKQSNMSFNGIPLSPLAKSRLEVELRKKGLMCVCL